MKDAGRTDHPHLIVMPDDGVDVVRHFIDGAGRSLSVKMFEFDCPTVLSTIVAAKARGVSVKVLLNPVRSNQSRPNDGTMATLREAGIDAAWTNPRFKITHEKSIVVDERRVLIATFNFSPKHFTRTRDYGLILEDSAVVAEVGACFEADWERRVFPMREGSPLAWGNDNARRVVADFIDAAKHRLHLQHPKFHDAAILDRVLAARHRGVTVHLLCGGAHGIEEHNLLETFANQRILARAGVRLRKQHHLKLHAKVMLADGHRAMVGSMNIDVDAYDVRRELGIVLDGGPAVAALQHRFEADWRAAKPYEAPDPVSLDLRTALDIDAPEAGGILHE